MATLLVSTEMLGLHGKLMRRGAPVQFDQKKADGEVRWAVLNTISMLRRHSETHDKLAAAMDSGASVGTCIGVIEDGLDNCDDI